MRRIGIIDNLAGIEEFRATAFRDCTAAEVMRSTGGNTGNVAFVYAVQQLVGNPRRRIEWSELNDNVHSELDQLVLCCANQIGLHADLGGWADSLARFGKPVTLIGLGAQSDNFEVRPSVPDGTRRFLEVVKELRPQPDAINVGVRGTFSQSVLKDLGFESVVTGCPSLLISGDRNLGQTILAKQSREREPWVAVAAGNPWHGSSAFLENVMVDVVEQFRGAYVLQHPKSMLEVAFNETVNIAEATRRRFLDVYQGRFDFDGLLRWYRRYGAVFVDAPNWIRFLQHFDLAIGSRFHGVALAIQGGVAGCVFAIDSRTREMCDEAGIKCLPVAQLRGLDASALVQACRWNAEDGARLDDQRMQKARVISSFLAANQIEVSPHLASLSC